MKPFSTHLLALCLSLLSLPAGALIVYQCEDEQGERGFYAHCPPGTTTVGQKKVATGHTPEKALDVPIVHYYVPECEACDLIREFFQLRKLAVVEKNVDNNVELQAELKGKAGDLKVPTVVIGDQVISGYNRSAMIKALETAGHQESTAASPPVEAPAIPQSGG